MSRVWVLVCVGVFGLSLAAPVVSGLVTAHHPADPAEAFEMCADSCRQGARACRTEQDESAAQACEAARFACLAAARLEKSQAPSAPAARALCVDVLADCARECERGVSSDRQACAEACREQLEMLRKR